MKTKSIHKKLEEKIREFEQELILLKKSNRKMKKLFKKYHWDKPFKLKNLEQIALAG